MPTLKTGPLANPDILSQIRRDLLLAWLWPLRDYFARRGLDLPSPDSDAHLSCDALAAIFLAPSPDMPADLLTSLYLFRELDNERAMDAIRDEIARQGLDLALGAEATALDVVVRAWTLNRHLVETLHQRLELKRPRSFKCFATDAAPIPPFAGPTPEQITHLETRLNSFYEAWKRGCGARVFPSRQGDHWLFLVRHGAPCRREGAMKDGEPTTVFFRPQRHDVLKYDPARGKLAVNCCADRERRVLLRLFGDCFFGRPDFFPAGANLTLLPLIQHGRGCLVCGDVPGIEHVTLTEVETQVPVPPRHCHIRKAGDIFHLVETAKLTLPADAVDITRATFLVKFARASRPRRFTIMPPDRVVYGREGDSPLLERFMRLRGFIAPGELSMAA
ncbi:MAG TPA: hypothetical protein VI136_12270 [Verrucomicrobiae bacterium]